MINFLGYPKVQYFDSNGDPLSGGQVFIYLTGSTTKTNSYPTISDAIAGTNANANPVVLDSRGEATIVVNRPVKIVVTASTDADPPTSPIFTVDNYYLPAAIYDVNRNELLDFTTTASAVNYLKIGNTATGNNPFIQGVGGDVTVGINFKDSNGNILAGLGPQASAVNYLNFVNSPTTSNVLVQALGSDTNISVAYQAKGTGTHFYSGGTTIQGWSNSGSVLSHSIASISSNRTATWPDQTGTVLLRDATGILDTNNNVILSFLPQASAVNYASLYNRATGASPILAVAGSDTNIGFVIATKGTGTLALTADTINHTSIAGTNILTFSYPSVTSTGYAFSYPCSSGVLRAENFTTTATAAGTTTLTVSSNRSQWFTGSTTQTCLLPVVSTLYTGLTFTIGNQSSGNVTVQSSGANTIATLTQLQVLNVKCISISGTGTASWSWWVSTLGG